MNKLLAAGFLFGALLAALGCYLRPDYNVPVMLFSGLLWNFKVQHQLTKPHVRATLLHIIIWTWLSDAVWLILHTALWNNDSAAQVTTRLHSLTLLVGAAIFVLKVRSKLTAGYTAGNYASDQRRGS